MAEGEGSSTLRTALQTARLSLLERGFAVLDSALSRVDADLLYEEMATLRERGVLRQHRFGFRSSTTSPPQIYEKPHIFEAELEDGPVRSQSPQLVATLARLRLAEEAASSLPELRLLAGNVGSAGQGVTVKLQCNEGHGGCFPLHYDNAGPPSRRRLTMLCYLNPNWRQSDGGELQLVPWLERAEHIPPLHGRIVLFLSDVMLHRVLPSRSRRFCFTVWIDGEGTNGADACSLKVGDPVRTCLALSLSPAQRLLSRAVYEREYAASIAECMAPLPCAQCAPSSWDAF